MTRDYIYPGSILVVDSTIPVESGKVIVCCINGWCVRRYVSKDPLVMLESNNSNCAACYSQAKIRQFQKVTLRYLDK